MYGEGRIAGVIEIFKRGFSFCERTGAFSLIKTKIVKKSVEEVHPDEILRKYQTEHCRQEQKQHGKVPKTAKKRLKSR